MRKRIRYILLITAGTYVFQLCAQNQNNFWFFGMNAGLNFNTIPPTPVVGELIQHEGCATISDREGNLLFYTNGQKIWDRTHNVMPNGFGLKGGWSSSQAALIVPLPKSCTKYYVFTTPQESLFINGPLSYSIVDMNLNDGLGDVEQSTKNTVVVNDVAEKVCAILHSNGIDIWIVTHTLNTNDFHAYLLTETGLNLTPTISSIGSIHYDSIFAAAVGPIRASGKGDKIVCTVPFHNICEMFDFNTLTGTLSNLFDLTSVLPLNAFYGIEFSPNDSLLYLATAGAIKDTNVLFQLNIFESTYQVVGMNNIETPHYASLQLGPDKKIYLAYWAKPYLGVINNPNKIGPECAFSEAAINIVPGTLSFHGLQNPAPYSFCLPLTLGKDLNMCEGQPLTLIVPQQLGSNCMQHFIWDNGSNEISREISEPGVYWIEVTSLCDSTYRDSIVIGLDSLTTTEIVTVCEGESYDGYTETGSYIDTVITSSGCDQVRTLHLQVNPISIESIYREICKGDTLEGYAQSGIYVDSLQNYLGCDSIRTLNLKVLDCPPIIYYDMNACESVMSQGTHMDYSEFTPAFPSTLLCAGVSANQIQRLNTPDNKHSCSPGINLTPAMCVNISNSCEYIPGHAASLFIEFSIEPASDSIVHFTHFEFYERSPVIYSWINGPSGLNNKPRFYGIRVLKNGVEVYAQSNIATSTNWALQSFNFRGNEDFIIKETSTFRIELLGYCPIGNSSDVAVWDIDELKIFARCTSTFNNSAIIEGFVKRKNGLPVQNAVIEIEDNEDFATPLITTTNEQGYYRFDSLVIGKTYYLRAHKQDDNLDGVSGIDLVRIQRHLLEISPFIWLDQFIAADANNSQQISALDLVEIKKLLLGIYSHFPDNTSWKIGIWPQDLAGPPFSHFETIRTIENLDAGCVKANFLAIKIGDVSD